MTKKKKLIRFIVAVLGIPYMAFGMIFLACIVWLSSEPDWDFYKELFSAYTDMLKFK